MIGDILSKIASALNNDKDILAYCTKEFTSPAKVIVGQNPEKQCSKEDMPAIVIGGIESGKANDTIREKKISIGIFIANEGEATIDEETSIITYAGFVQCEELTELVETCLLKMNYKSLVEYKPLQSEKFPIYSANVIFTIEKIIPIRGVK